MNRQPRKQIQNRYVVLNRQAAVALSLQLRNLRKYGENTLCRISPAKRVFSVLKGLFQNGGRILTRRHKAGCRCGKEDCCPGAADREPDLELSRILKENI